MLDFYHGCDGGHIQIQKSIGRGSPVIHGPRLHLNVITIQAKMFHKIQITAVISGAHTTYTQDQKSPGNITSVFL